MEAEYVVLSLAAGQTIWYKKGLQELGISASITLLGDNQSAQSLVSNPVLHQRSKHIDVHFHYTHEKAQ